MASIHGPECFTTFTPQAIHSAAHSRCSLKTYMSPRSTPQIASVLLEPPVDCRLRITSPHLFALLLFRTHPYTTSTSHLSSSSPSSLKDKCITFYSLRNLDNMLLDICFITLTASPTTSARVSLLSKRCSSASSLTSVTTIAFLFYVCHFFVCPTPSSAYVRVFLMRVLRLRPVPSPSCCTAACGADDGPEVRLAAGSGKVLEPFRLTL